MKRTKYLIWPRGISESCLTTGEIDEMITRELQSRDEPIKDDHDLWLRICEAQLQMDHMLVTSNRYKYIRESQRKANYEIFENLKRLVEDYSRSRRERKNNTEATAAGSHKSNSRERPAYEEGS